MEKSVSAFFKDSGSPDGLSRRCKDCWRVYNAKHKERLLGNKRRYYLRNKERIDSWNRAYMHRRSETKEGLASALLSHAKMRARKRNRPFDLTYDYVLKLVDVEICTIPWCHKPINYSRKSKVCWDSPSLDCLIPSKGYVRGNVTLIHHKCNLRKQDLIPSELRALADWIDAQTEALVIVN